jgi:hypothetical protein
MAGLLTELQVGDCHLKYVEGLQILISFSQPFAACEVLKKESIWNKWLSKLEWWMGQSTPFERIVWLDIIGVPPMLWDRKVFDQIGSLFGSIMFHSKADRWDGNFTCARVAILTDNVGRISEVIRVQWKEKKFQCRVVEIEEDEKWVPDFLCPVIADNAGAKESDQFSPPELDAGTRIPNVPVGSPRVATSCTSKSSSATCMQKSFGIHWYFQCIGPLSKYHWV